jgi:ArsR family transcriptional regulator, arsenate/arsenite/antimonite-responsive transcriptional repressor
MYKSESVKLSEEEIRLAKIFKALGNPTRLLILRHMAGCQPCKCGNIVADLPLAQSTVSQHLKVLRESGLIVGEVDGPSVCYCMNMDTLAWLKLKMSALPW